MIWHSEVNCILLPVIIYSQSSQNSSLKNPTEQFSWVLIYCLNHATFLMWVTCADGGILCIYVIRVGSSVIFLPLINVHWQNFCYPSLWLTLPFNNVMNSSNPYHSASTDGIKLCVIWFWFWHTKLMSFKRKQWTLVVQRLWPNIFASTDEWQV